MRCASCRRIVSDDAKYCSNCGKPVARSAEEHTQADLFPPKTSTRARYHWPKLVRSLVTIVLIVLLGKIAGYVLPPVRELLRAGDNFVWDSVRNGAPFHFVAVFHRELMRDLSSQRSGNLGTIIATAIAAYFQAIGVIVHESPGTIFTTAVVLFIGVAITYDPKNGHPVLTALSFGPLVGGVLVYVLMGLMAGLSLALGFGAKVLTFCATTVPLVKEGVDVAVEAKKHQVAERFVDHMAK
jgi:hypothetical protein